MEGKNELILCGAETRKAMQLYIDHLMPNQEVRVTDVMAKEKGGCPEVVIRLEPEKVRSA